MTTNKTLEKYSKLMGSGWARHLLPFLESNEMRWIAEGIKADMQNGNTIYPLFDDIFRCFKESPWENTHTVFLATNPYVKGQADGILFSCSKSEFASDTPAVLNKVLDAVEEDYGNGLYLNKKNNLEHWANAGVLLLPLNLTVIRDKPTSHLNLWKPFIIAVLQALNAFNCGVVYVLCGVHAQSMEKHINKEVNDIYMLEHPMTAVVEKRAWEHQNIFTTCNRVVKFLNNTKVDWTA